MEDYRARLFGSALRDDFNPESNIDLLVTFDGDAHWTLFDMVDMQEELKDILDRSSSKKGDGFCFRREADNK